MFAGRMAVFQGGRKVSFTLRSWLVSWLVREGLESRLGLAGRCRYRIPGSRLHRGVCSPYRSVDMLLVAKQSASMCGFASADCSCHVAMQLNFVRPAKSAARHYGLAPLYRPPYPAGHVFLQSVEHWLV
jgi:hypothetical protein